MICPNCSSPNDDNARFCAECGTPFVTESESTVDVHSPSETPRQTSAPAKRPSPLMIALVVLGGVIAGTAIAAAVTLFGQSSGPVISDQSTAETKQRAGVDEKSSDDTATATPMKLKDAKSAFVGSWDFISSMNAPEDYNGTFVIREDQTAVLRLLEMGLPDENGAQAILGEGEAQEYTWDVAANGITLHPQDGTTAFDGADVQAQLYSDWPEDDYWTHTIVLDETYILGSEETKKRAGWDKRVDCGDFDVYQVRDMDVSVGDDDRFAIHVIGAGYNKNGYVGYLLEVTNKTDEEAVIGFNYESYEKWTIAGSAGPNPDFQPRYIDPAGKDGTPTTKFVFMSFSPSFESMDGSTSYVGYDGDLDGFHDVVGILEMRLQDSFEDTAYDFHME